MRSIHYYEHVISRNL